jgi:ribosomal protein S18 acetylase RimI-like enzyme
VDVLADAVSNHLCWFGRARERIDVEGVAVFLGRGDAVLGFPAPDANLSEAVRWALDAGVEEVGCWSAEVDPVLDRRLTELGFQDGWEPHWMGFDLRDPIAEPSHPVERTDRCSSLLPYASETHLSVLGDDVVHLGVGTAAALAGHCIVNVDGRTAGLYDMGVAVTARRRGHGRALTLAALETARDRGCTTVTLNATREGERVYRAAGFRSLGRGMTWWLFPKP